MGAGGVELARTLRERRRALGLTRSRLAERTGLKAGDVTRWERGEDLPGPEAVIVLAEAIGLEIDETQTWLDLVTVDLTGPDVRVELVESSDAPSDPFTKRTAPLRENTSLLAKIADRLARRDEQKTTDSGDGSVTRIREPAPRRTAPAATTGLVRAPLASQLPSVFPDPAIAPYDPAVHIYSTTPVSNPIEADDQIYLLRRVRTGAVLLGLGLVLWWALGALGEGFGDVLDLFRTPTG